jgi:hypothetical protein
MRCQHQRGIRNLHLYGETNGRFFITTAINVRNTGQFKKKVTLSHVYNAVTSEPTIMRYTTVRKTLKVCL